MIKPQGSATQPRPYLREAMMYLRIPLLLPVLLLAATLLAQPRGATPNEIDAKGRKQGPWSRTWADSDQLRYTGQFKDDRPVGRFTYFSTKGLLESTVDHYPDGSAAHARHYHTNGKLMAIGRYVGQEKDSTWNYYDETGTLMAVERFQKGKLHGEKVTYYEDGAVSERIHFVNGVEDGLREQYFSSGKLKHKANYVKGEPDGMLVWYYPDGKKEMEGRMVKGLHEGTWYSFDRDGSIRSQQVYVNGSLVKDIRLNGVFKDHYPSERLRSEHTWKNGKLNGPFKEYHDNGQFVERTLEPDPVVGDLPGTEKVLRGQQLKRDGTYRDGMLHGIVSEYDANGRLLSRTTYMDGIPQTKP